MPLSNMQGLLNCPKLPSRQTCVPCHHMNDSGEMWCSQLISLSCQSMLSPASHTHSNILILGRLPHPVLSIPRPSFSLPMTLSFTLLATQSNNVAIVNIYTLSISSYLLTYFCSLISISLQIHGDLQFIDPTPFHNIYPNICLPPMLMHEQPSDFSAAYTLNSPESVHSICLVRHR